MLELATAHGVPVVETVAGRTLLPEPHPLNAGPLGIIGSTSANTMAAEADVVVAIGTRLQDFTTASWTLFSPDVRLIGVNAARFDAVKRGSHEVVGDARRERAGAGSRAPRVVGRPCVDRARGEREGHVGRAHRHAARRGGP